MSTPAEWTEHAAKAIRFQGSTKILGPVPCQCGTAVWWVRHGTKRHWVDRFGDEHKCAAAA